MPSQILHPEAMLLNHPFTPTSHLHGWVLVTCGSLSSVDPRGLGRGCWIGPHREASEGNLGPGLCVPESYGAVHVTLGPPKTSHLLPDHRDG